LPTFRAVGFFEQNWASHNWFCTHCSSFILHPFFVGLLTSHIARPRGLRLLLFPGSTVYWLLPTGYFPATPPASVSGPLRRPMCFPACYCLLSTPYCLLSCHSARQCVRLASTSHVLSRVLLSTVYCLLSTFLPLRPPVCLSVQTRDEQIMRQIPE
jgi:hypothetical protein